MRDRLVLAVPIALFGLYGLGVYWLERRELEVLYISLGILGVATVIALVPWRQLFGLFATYLGVASIYQRGDYPFPIVSVVLGVVFVVFGFWLLFTRNKTTGGSRSASGGGGDGGGYDHGDVGNGAGGD
jgi:uncharacterized membrane protein YgcG